MKHSPVKWSPGYAVLVLIGALFIIAAPAVRDSMASAAGDVRKGNKLYEQKKYTEAAGEYSHAKEKKADEPVIDFDLGAALYKTGKFKEAAEAFTRTMNTDDRGLEAKAAYNMANTLYQAGRQNEDADMQGAESMYRSALDYYRRAMEMDSSDRDAKYNHELVQQRLKALMEKMKQQEKKQDRKQQKDNSEKKEGKDQKPDSGKDKKDSGKGDRNKTADSGDNKDKEQKGSQQSAAKDGEDKKDDEMQSRGAEKQKTPMSPEEASMLLDAYGQEGDRRDLADKQRGLSVGAVKNW